MGIDIWEVIEAAKTKPFGFMPFYPGRAWGTLYSNRPVLSDLESAGIWPEYAIHRAGGEVNTAMPGYVINRTIEALNYWRKPMNGSKVLVLGLAYKANVDDMRESPAFHLLDMLQARGANLPTMIRIFR